MSTLCVGIIIIIITEVCFNAFQLVIGTVVVEILKYIKPLALGVIGSKRSLG